MSRYFIIIFAFMTLWLANIKASPKLSQDAYISVLTCSAGDELYSAFGHTAIRVCDTQKKIDLVFNYGTFDFNTPNFYLKFADGKLNYMLSASKFKQFMSSYFHNNRSVIEQVLNLDQANKQKLFDALLINYKPENRYYKYDFFYDNCATRIFDIIIDNNSIELCQHSKELSQISFRTYLHHYLNNSSWIETGLNIILGLPADKVTTLKESTFLPDFLTNVLEGATIKTNDDQYKKLILKTETLLERDLSIVKADFIISSSTFFWAILVLVLCTTFFIKKINICIADRILFGTTGIIGLLIAYLWLVTDHEVTRYNLNILWAFPSFIILVFLNWSRPISMLLFKLHIFLLCVFIVGWFWIPQEFPKATLPIAITLIIRLLFIFKSQRQFQTNKSTSLI